MKLLMMNRTLKILQRLTSNRIFDALQIEVTSRCNLRCVMCPVTALADHWHSQHIRWELFLRIARSFEHTKFVHLQGWGEPLLHARFFDMIQVAKEAGCRVGFTTNGTLLSVLTGQRLLDLKIDLMAVSIAGATSQTHGQIRVGSNLSRILNNVHRFLHFRAQRRERGPKVKIFFLMTKTNMAELPRVVDLVATLGADELVATNLDYVPTHEQDALRAFGRHALTEEVARVLEEARARAKAVDLAFRSYPLEPEEVAVCEANPLKILFVSSDGKVSPCTHMGLAGQTEIPRVFDGKPLSVPRVYFGDMNEQELVEIWNSPAYRAFRQQFEARRTAGVAWAVAAVAGGSPASCKTFPPAPESCQSCPKLFGF